MQWLDGLGLLCKEGGKVMCIGECGTVEGVWNGEENWKELLSLVKNVAGVSELAEDCSVFKFHILGTPSGLVNQAHWSP